MTLLVRDDERVATPRAARAGAVIVVLAMLEARRMWRNPLLCLGLGASLYYLWDITPSDEEWAGAHYAGMMITSAFLLLAISLVTAVSFHRERTQVAIDAPVAPTARAVARLAAALSLIGLAIAFAFLAAWRQRDLGGLPLGVEPGRTTEALQTAAELAQHVALAVLAVALGAAAGRRTSRLVMVFPLLFIFWFFAVATYWLFSHPDVVPFSIVQVQPVSVPIGPESADPLQFPEGWLLSAPDVYQPGWHRLIVSSTLAWFHNVWLLGLSSLTVSCVVPAGRLRRALLVCGIVAAGVGVLGQLRVIP